jgi:dipeptidyl aminopeptidase/acylaminoacyl peptidase
VFPFAGDIQSIDAAAGTIAFVGREPNRLAEIYLAKDGAAARKTDLNAAFLAEKFVSIAKHIPFTNSDGVTIDGWALEPFGYDPGQKYPGVLEIHGGPRCTYGDVFFHEMQALAGAGHFVLFCNPRGGEGYGEEFADLRGRYGTVDYLDLMEFTDHALKCYPQIDASRLGAAGGSYGGFMCNWIEGHTDRFAALASQRSISNWVADFGTSEIGFTFDGNEMGATPWTDMEKMWAQSPLKYAHNAKTPILFIHSLGDYNCPIDQGAEMFTAMKFFGVPARMCVFEGENHSLSRSGKPRHRIRRLTEIVNWFDRYLK